MVSEAQLLTQSDNSPDDAGPPDADTGAPIVLVTGLPGSGKTLRALFEFAVGKRNVYQHGITGCKLPTWDPKKWTDLPRGSTLIVDEAREVYPPTNATAAPPLHYQLHKIRHHGLSLVIIAQHPNDIDARVRRLVGRHLHLVNIFGTQSATVYEWSECQTDVDSRKGAQSKIWRYPKAVYSLYTSSAHHRKTVRIPPKVLFIPVLISAIALLFGGGLWYIKNRLTPDSAGPASSLPGPLASKVKLPPSIDSGPSAGHAGDKRSAPLNAATYIAQRVPILPGLPHTAPVYAEVTQPVEAPRPAACVASDTRCQCYSQQGTHMDVPDNLCRSIVARGYFVDWIPSHPTAVPMPAVSPIVPAAGRG